jgi:hypothetical protein
VASARGNSLGAFEDASALSSESDPVMLRLDEARDEIAELDSRKAQLIEMHYFGSLKH